jgi:hypothetical protein
MKKIDNFKIDQIPVWKICVTTTSTPDYSMDRTYFVEDWPDYGDYTLVTGGHCSCFNFDETDWDAITYTKDEIKKVVENWKEEGYGSEISASELILEQLE